jgi:hypothetical protein
MFIAVYVVFAVGDAEGGRLPVGSRDESRVMLDTELFSLNPKYPTAAAVVANSTAIVMMAIRPQRMP